MTTDPSHPRPPPPPADMEIGSEALKNARGLAFLTSYTVGFFGGGTFSHGILIAKKPGTEQWGLPVAISGGGATAMFGLGYREDICMYLLESDAAVQSTFGNHSLKVRREEPARDSPRRQLENRVSSPRRNTRRIASAREIDSPLRSSIRPRPRSFPSPGRWRSVPWDARRTARRTSTWTRRRKVRRETRTTTRRARFAERFHFFPFCGSLARPPPLFVVRRMTFVRVRLRAQAWNPGRMRNVRWLARISTVTARACSWARV